jgi:hypothetical protein
VTIEVQVFGRQSLALGAVLSRPRARAPDPACSSARTIPTASCFRRLERKPFLVANGADPVLRYLDLAQEIPALKAAGVSRYRLSPHSCDMVQVATTFRGVLDGVLTAKEALAVFRKAARCTVLERLPSRPAGLRLDGAKRLRRHTRWANQPD